MKLRAMGKQLGSMYSSYRNNFNRWKKDNAYIGYLHQSQFIVSST